MVQVERHHIKGTPEIADLCQKSARLYNKCNFLMRQEHFAGRKVLNQSDIWEMFHDQPIFLDLHNTKTAMQTIRKCLTDWSNYFKSLKAWKKDKSKFIRLPKPPAYKKKMAQVIFFSETIKHKPLKNGEIVPTNFLFNIKSKHCNDFKQVVITPKTFGFVIDISFEVPKTPQSKQPGVCSIDIGVNNLCAITSDQHLPILIKGGIAKSLNQWFNKNRSKQRSKKRYWRLENLFHHTSKFIIENCKSNNIGTIIIGRNEGWKQKTKFKKRSKTSQNFQSIPFFKLQEKIKFKAEQENIKVVFTEEAWTSQASFIDNDPIPAFEKGSPAPQMSGTRVERGLFRTQDGLLLNADVNGSLNIARKVIPEAVEDSRWNRSVGATPVVVNPLKWFHQTAGPMGPGLTARTSECFSTF